MSTCLSHLWGSRFLEGFGGTDDNGCVFDFAKQLEEIYGEPRAEVDESLDEFLERIFPSEDDYDELLEG